METELPPVKMEHPTTEEEAFEWHIPNVPDYKPEQWVINELNMRIEYALRHLVKPTIKKEITRGKIRWRGIYVHTLVCESSEVYKVRLFQRDHEINLNYTGKEMERYKEFRIKHELG